MSVIGALENHTRKYLWKLYARNYKKTRLDTIPAPKKCLLEKIKSPLRSLIKHCETKTYQSFLSLKVTDHIQCFPAFVDLRLLTWFQAEIVQFFIIKDCGTRFSHHVIHPPLYNHKSSSIDMMSGVFYVIHWTQNFSIR